MKSVVFSIVSHGHQQMVQDFICSLSTFLDSSDCDLKIVVRDNLNEGLELDPCGFVVIIERNYVQQGFGKNHNDTFCEFPCDFFFVLNPELKLISPWKLAEMVDEVKDCVYTVSLVGEMGENIGHIRNELTLVNVIRRKIGLVEKETTECWVSGAFLAFEWSVFANIGGFDENFKMYVEDCDLCVRAQSQSFPLKLDKRVSLIHSAQRDSSKSIKLFMYHLASLSYFMLKKIIFKFFHYDVGKYIIKKI